MYNNYKLKVNFNDTSKKDLTISWDKLCQVCKISIANPNTYQLIDDKQTLDKAFELDLDDVIVYADELPIL